MVAFAACADTAAEPTTKALPARQYSCADSLAGDAARAGQTGAAWLLYPCKGSDCTGSERFARGLRHAIQLEVDGPPQSAIVVKSTDERVAGVFDVVTAYDPCANKVRAWATLDARGVGETTLSILDAHGELDTIELAVADPATIRLRASPTTAFAFQGLASTLLVAEGESWLVFPELYDAERVLLVGQPPLTWEVEDSAVAEVRPVRGDTVTSERTTPGAVEVEAKLAGETALHVHTPGGAAASVTLRVSGP